MVLLTECDASFGNYLPNKTELNKSLTNDKFIRIGGWTGDLLCDSQGPHLLILVSPVSVEAPEARGFMCARAGYLDS